jgi:hypothetical protein
MTIPEGTDQTVDTKTMTVDNYASVQIPWTGEDMKHVNNGNGFETVYGDQIRQAIRAICNTVETSVWTAAYKGASRAVGTAGHHAVRVQPRHVLADLRKILADNGCPMDGQITLAMNTSAGAAMRKLAICRRPTKRAAPNCCARARCSTCRASWSRNRPPRFSHQGHRRVLRHLRLDRRGRDRHRARHRHRHRARRRRGDLRRRHQQQVRGRHRRRGPRHHQPERPRRPGGDRHGQRADRRRLYTPNVAFHRSAIELGMRAPAMPAGGDAAVDIMTVQDPWSGLVFEIAAYKGYMKSMFEVRCVYGSKVWKPNHVATLRG